jgi:multidrug efflux pump
VQTAGGLTEVEQFRNIVIRSLPDGSVVRVRDVARVELGADDYQIESRLNGKPAVAMGVYLRPGGNALALAEAIAAKMDELGQLPARDQVVGDLRHHQVRHASIELVLHTFVEAFVLVLIVVYLFLGSLRATIIPLLAIPVSIIGTMAGLLLDGLLDQHADAVRPGAGDRHRGRRRDRGGRGGREDHARRAPRRHRGGAIKAMKGIGGAIVGVTAVICAVFVPIAFLGGVTGTLYKQFAITITIRRCCRRSPR